MLMSIRALSGQCRPSGTRNGYSIGMRMAKTKGAFEFIQERPTPRPLPSQTPRGPSRKAVTGIMIAIDRKGTNTICTFAGKIFCRPL